MSSRTRRRRRRRRRRARVPRRRRRETRCARALTVYARLCSCDVSRSRAASRHPSHDARVRSPLAPEARFVRSRTVPSRRSRLSRRRSPAPPPAPPSSTSRPSSPARPRRAKSTPSSSPAGVATAPLPSPRRVSALAIALPRPLVSRAPLDSPPRRRCPNTWRWTCARWRRPGGGARARGEFVCARASAERTRGGECGSWRFGLGERVFAAARRIVELHAARVRASGGARDASRRRARQKFQ